MPYGADLLLIDRFLEMMAAEAGASKNTLLAYQRDLVATSELLEGRLGVARTEDLSSPCFGLVRSCKFKPCPEIRLTAAIFRISR